MLTSLQLKQFKCFSSTRLSLRALTLLSGPNSSGKSSVLQALVLLHQTMREHEWSTRLALNGSTIRLGTVTDVVNRNDGRYELEIGVEDEQLLYNWHFAGERRDMSMQVVKVEVGRDQTERPEVLRHLLPPVSDAVIQPLAARLRKLTYISAERIGPREVYPLDDRQSGGLVGPKGENTVSVLYWGQEESVLSGLAVDDVSNTRLRQVQAHMGKLFPDCRVSLAHVPRTSAVVLRLSTSSSQEYYSPIHTGFGLTQVLPIVVAALSEVVGGIMLVENPEIHLHPAGQAAMGAFLAEVANAGVQVIVETHSDHVLNGIRRAVRMQHIKNEQVAIHFFGSSRPDGGAQVVSPTLYSNGNISDWPRGFFDQFDKDMSYFAGLDC